MDTNLAQKIWQGDYISLLSESTNQEAKERTKIRSQEGGRKSRRRVADILQWVERFHTYINMAIIQQPARASNLLAYASLIVHAARKFRGDGWLQYDGNLRKRAVAFPSEEWAEVNPLLWILAFSNANAKPHCTICFSLHHCAEECKEYEEPKVANHPYWSCDHSGGMYTCSLNKFKAFIKPHGRWSSAAYQVHIRIPQPSWLLFPPSHLIDLDGCGC